MYKYVMTCIAKIPDLDSGRLPLIATSGRLPPPSQSSYTLRLFEFQAILHHNPTARPVLSIGVR